MRYFFCINVFPKSLKRGNQGRSDRINGLTYSFVLLRRTCPPSPLKADTDGQARLHCVTEGALGSFTKRMDQRGTIE